MILDLGLPKRDGIEILRTIRQKGISVPVLVLTARDSIEDRVEGLEAGADDYMVKPFAFAELLARIHALLRRRHAIPDSVLSLGDLRLDMTTRKASRNGVHLQLTSKELELLEYFLRRKDTVVSREMLVRDIWNAATRATPLDNVIDVHITHLRRKLEGPAGSRLLHTIRGVGFILSERKP